MSRGKLCVLLFAVGTLLVPAGTSIAEGEVGLTLSEALHMALQNNLDLVSARKDPEISDARVTEQTGAFDATLNSSLIGFGFQTKPNDQFTTSGVGNTLRLTEQLLKEFYWGGDIDIQLRLQKREGAGTPVSILQENFYESTLDMTFNVPLLRGRGKVNNTEFLQLAVGNRDISQEELRRQAETTIEVVEGAYWDLLAAHAALDVANQALKRAQDLLDLNRKKVEVGTLAPIEITQAKAGVASQEEGVILAEETLGNARDELLRLLAMPWDDPRWDQNIKPSDRPEFEPREINLDGAIETALQSRPEMTSAERDLKNKNLSERVKRNGVKHGLDLSMNYAPVGNSFLPQNAPPIRNVAGQFPDSIEDLVNSDFYNYSIALTYSVPIQNRVAKGVYRVATLEREKAEIGLQNQEQTIKVEVRLSARAVTSGAKRVSAAQENIRLQREKLEAEQKKYDNGMSTSFEVLTFQNDLADAELAGIRAVLDYNKALAAFERSKGTLLPARGLSLTE